MAGGLAVSLAGLWLVGQASHVHRPQPADAVACAIFSEGFSTCYAPGSDLERVRAAELRTRLQFGLAYSAQTRWLRTATDGLVSGDDPVTLTYSFVPDSLLRPEGPTNTIFATLNAQFGGPAGWQNIFAEVFEHWSQLTGNKYVFQPTDDGALWPDSPGQLGVRGDIRIIAYDIDGRAGILAFNYFPSTGDMALDAGELWADSRNDFIFMRNVLMHEHGHGLGLGHVLPRNGTKLMEAFYSEGFRGPQDDDIRGANKFYGDRFEVNDSLGATVSFGTFSDGMVIDDLSINNGGDVDWYSLTVPAGTLLGVDVIPIGATYPVSPDPGTPQTIDTRAIHRLAIDVRDSSGMTVLGSAEAAAAGEEANVSGVEAPGGVLRLKVSSKTPANPDVQRYRMRILQRGVLPRTLRLQSAPAGGVVISYAPADLNGASSAVTNVDRTFSSGASVTLTAPATFNSEPFGRWKLDGISQPLGQRNLTVLMNRDHVAVADYSDVLSVDAGPDRKVAVGGQVTLSAAVAGGAPPYSFRWTPVGSLSSSTVANPIASPLQTTTYQVTVTDNVGTQESDDVVVQIVPRLSVSLGDRVPVAANLPFTITANVNGGIEPYEFSWSPLAPADHVEGSSLTTVAESARRVTVVVTDSTGARATDSVDVEIVQPLKADLGPGLTVLKNTTLTLEARLADGVKPYTVVWSANAKLIGPDGLTATVTPEATSVYQIIATDAVGQSVSAEKRVVVASQVSLEIQADPASIRQGETTTLTAVVKGGAPPFAIRWAPANQVADAGALSTTASPRATTRFACTVMDALNQVATAELDVTVGASVDDSSSNNASNDDDDGGVPTALGGGLCGLGLLSASIAMALGMLLMQRRRV